MVNPFVSELAAELPRLRADAVDGAPMAVHRELGTTLLLLSEYSEPAVLDEAITALRTAMDSGDKTSALLMSAAYAARYAVGGDVTDVQAALRVFRPGDDGIEPSPAMPLEAIGRVREAQFAASGEIIDLYLAIFFLRAAVRADPSGLASGYLGRTLLSRWQQFDERADLDAAVRAFRQYEAAGAPGPDGLETMAIAGAAYVMADPEAVDDAIALLRRIRDLAPTGSPAMTAASSNLAEALIRRGSKRVSKADLDEAVLLRRAAPMTSAQAHQDLGMTLLARARMLDVPQDYAEAALEFRSAVAATAATDPGLPDRLSMLSDALLDSYRHTHSRADLIEAQRAFGTAQADLISQTPVELAAAIIDKYTKADPADLRTVTAAIGILTALIPALGDQAPRTLYIALTDTFLIRFEITGDAEDLEDGITNALTAAQIASEGPQRIAAARNLGRIADVLFDAYNRTNDADALNRSIEMYGRCVAALPPEQPGLSAVQHKFGISLRVRADRDRSIEDAGQAIDHGRAAVAAGTTSEHQYPRYLSALGVALCTRFELTGNRADIEEAIQLHRDAVALANEDLKAEISSDLSIVLTQFFQHTGDQKTLDEAIDVARSCVTATSADDPDRVRRLFNLAGPLRYRFMLLERRADIDEVISVLQQVAATAPRAQDRSGALQDLAFAYVLRFYRLGDAADAQAAVDAAKTGVTVAHSAEVARAQSILGSALEARYLAADGGLEDAVTAYRAAVAATPVDDLRRPGFQDNLAGVLLQRLEAEPDPVQRSTLLAEALDVSRAALDALPPDDFERGTALYNLGLAYQSAGDTVAGIDAFRQAAHWPTSPAAVRCSAARNWGILAATAGDFSEAAAGFGTAVELLPLVAAVGLYRSDQEYQLGRYSGLASDAAVCAITASMPMRAIELLEHGRGVLFSRASQGKDDLAVLREAHPDLARRFAEVRGRLDSATDPHVDVDADTMQRLAAQSEELVQEIRRRHGFAAFLLPPTDLLEAAAAGPVIAVNVSEYGCHALVLNRDDAQPVALDGLKLEELRERVTDLLTDMELSATSYRHRVAAADKLTSILAWLWNVLAEPIVDHLHLPRRAEPEQRLWWLPTGLLSLLPLHAAGYPEDPDRSMLHRAVSSYTPTLRSLARASLRSARTPDRSIVVSVPGELIEAEREAHEVAALLPGAVLLREATPEQVRHELTRAAFAHFACHATSNLNDPTSGHLLLSGGDLGVQDIAKMDTSGAALAYLSACSGARGGIALADEVITVASAFQLAGYPQVIGSLWPLGDEAARMIAGSVYRACPVAAGNWAAALHRAVLAAKDDDPGDVLNWAAPIHIGA